MKKFFFLLFWGQLALGQEALRFTVPNASTDNDLGINDGINGYFEHHECISNNKLLHMGIDTWAPENSIIKSPADGIVEFIIDYSNTCPPTKPVTDNKKRWCNLGYSVGIRHPRMGKNGEDLFSLFLHMNTTPAVNIRQEIKMGQIIGYIGKTGNSGGQYHTHFEFRNFDYSSSTAPYHLVSRNIYPPCSAISSTWAQNEWEDPESITIPNFGQTIYAGNASNPQNIQIIFKVPEWTNNQSFNSNSITNIQINNDVVTENIASEANISKFSNLGNNWYSFDLNLPSGRAWVNGQNYDLRFNISTSERSLRAFGSNIVKFSNGNFTDHQFRDRWVEDYARRAGLLGLIGGEGTLFKKDDPIDFATAARLVVNAGIKLRILSNNSAGLTGFFDNNVPSNFPKSDASYYNFQILNNWGYTIPTSSSITPTEPINTEQLTKMLTAAFEITTATNNTLLNVINLTPNSSCTSTDNNLLKNKYVYKESVLVKPYAEPILSCSHSGSTLMTKAIITKMLVNLFEYKHQVNFQVSPSTNARISSTTSSNEFQVIGIKKEFQSSPSGSTLPQFTDPPVTMTAGQQRTFAFPDVTVDGQPVSCYWSVDGGILQQQGAGSYFQSIKWTAPSVSTPTTFHLYMYATTARGYASESIRDIIVNPTSSSFSVSATDQDLCFGESSTLTASNCNGTVLWNTNLGTGNAKTVQPLSNTTYFAYCQTGGNSIKSNEVYVIVNQRPNPPNLNASSTFLQQGQSATLNAYGCSGGVVNWNNGLGTGTMKTVSPSTSTVYSAYCTKNGCISDLTSIIITRNTINCSIGEPNNTATTAYDLGEYNSEVRAAYRNRFCFTSGDNTDWYKIKIYNKIYYIRVYDSGGNCSGSYCDYVLEFELIADNLLIHFGSIYTEAIYVQVYDSNTTTLLMQGINSTGNVNLNLNVCNALSLPINITRNYKCGPSGGYLLKAKHHLAYTEHYLDGFGNYISEIEWFDSATSTNILEKGEYYHTPPFSVPTTFYTSLRISPTCTTPRVPVFVDVYPTAAAPTITASKTAIAVGESVSLSANCSGVANWWYHNLGISNTILVSPNQTTLYQVNCSDQPCNSASAQITINVVDVNPPSISSDVSKICAGQLITLTASNCGGTVNWSNNLGSGNSKTFYPADTKTYTAYCSSNGLNSGNSNEVTIIVTPIPEVPLILTDKSTIKSGSEISLSVSNCNGAVNWVGGLGTANTIHVNPISTSTYKAVCVANGCLSNESSIIITTIDCPQNLNVGITAPGDYRGEQISVNSNIVSGIRLLGENSILLLPGFSVGENEVFEAKTEACDKTLLLNYPFNGNALDASESDNHGTIEGNAILSTGVKGEANGSYCFDGVNDFINTSLRQTNATTYSISAWVKTNMNQLIGGKWYAIVQNRGAELSGGKSLTLGYSSEQGKWFYVMDTDNVITGVAISKANDDNWMHIVGVWTGSAGMPINANQFKIYVDGVLQNTSTIGNNSENPVSPISGLGTTKIGYHQAWNTYFQGCIDNVRIYNQSLTDTDVLAIYNQERAIAPSNGLVAHYPFNGDSYDESGNGNHGTVNGAILATDRHGNVGKSYRFNGIDNWIEVPHSSTLNCQKVTISVWVKASDWYQGICKSNYIITKGWDSNQNYGLYYYGNMSDGCTNNVQNVGVQGWRGSQWVRAVSDANSIQQNLWFHTVGVYDGISAKLYLNGVLVSEAPFSGNLSTNDQKLFIGRNATGNTLSDDYPYFVNGIIDDIRIYNRALSDLEIQQLYNFEKPIASTHGLVAYYPFSGNTNDESGNNKTLANTNATLTTDRKGQANSAYYFNGNANLISNNVSYLYNTSFSISYWAKPDMYGGQMFIRMGPPANNSGLHIAFRSSGSSYTFAFYANDYDLNNFKKDGLWHQYTLVYDKDLAIRKVYEDGILLGTQVCNSPLYAQNTPLILGYSWGDTYTDHLTGKLDDIRIYNRALTDTEVSQIYSSEK